MAELLPWKPHNRPSPIQTTMAALRSTVSHSVLASQPTLAHARVSRTHITARVMTAWWHKPPFPQWHATKGGLLVPPCCHGAGRDERLGRRKNVVAGPHFHTPMLATQWLST